VVLVLVGAGCGKYSSPEKTLSFLIKTMEEGSVDAYLGCYTKESQEILKMLKLTSEGLRVSVSDYKNAKFKVTEKIGDMAVMTSEIAGNRVLVFKKEKGEWKVDITVLKRDTKRMADLMGTLRSGALEFYFADHASYPVLTDTSENGEFLKVLVDDGYLAEILLDPLHPEYFYEYEGTVDSYSLKCYCEIGGGYCDMADGIKDHALIIAFPK